MIRPHPLAWLFTLTLFALALLMFLRTCDDRMRSRAQLEEQRGRP